MKEEAGKQSARYVQELDSVMREQKADQDRLDNLLRVRREVQNQLEQRQHELAEAEKRSERLLEHIRTSETALGESRKLRDDMFQEVNTAKAQVEVLNKRLEDVVRSLDDARTDRQEDARRRKKQEVVDNLKRLHRGIYDRVVNMCHPVHQRYNVAVTKVLGKYLDAIVVDTEDTARNCIQYLKEQLLEPETFLPLNYLQVNYLFR